MVLKLMISTGCITKEKTMVDNTITIKLVDLQDILVNLGKEGKKGDDKYRSAYMDGVLDFFNAMKNKIEPMPKPLIKVG